MNIVKKFLTNNPCYKAGKKITVKGLMLHSVGCPQPNAMVFVNSFNSGNYSRSCVHGFIDGNNGTIYQTLPWNHRAWHCGSGKNGSGNDTHIGVEMCEPSNIKYTAGSSFTCSNLKSARTVAKRTYQSAVELFAYLCKEYKLNPLKDGVIISHKEGNARGIASNHGDPEHLWRGLGLNYTMDKFRKAVKAKMNAESNNKDSDKVDNIKFPKTPFTVKVLISNLNYRSMASLSGKVLGQVKKGTYTITKVENGWGKLKSKDGWIYLKNTSYVKIGSTVKTTNNTTSTSTTPLPYRVKVIADALNIRKGAGTNYAISGVIKDKGVYTIIEESTGKGATKWLKLKSGTGWIASDYTKIVK